jgi:hypothetical protein
MFDVQERYTNGFTCVVDSTVYQVLAYDHATRQTHVWTWLQEVEKWDFTSPIPDAAMRQIALELYLVFDILLEGYDYLSPSTRARKRAVQSAMRAYALECTG